MITTIDFAAQGGALQCSGTEGEWPSKYCQKYISYFYNNLEDHYESTEVYTLFADMDKSLLFDDEGLEGKSVRQTTVGDVFKKDKEMLFLFDYGDDWFFHIRCLDEDAPREKGKRYPKVIESKGKAPEQYPDYEEEDEE